LTNTPFVLGHSPANLMGPSLNVSELEDLVRLLSGSEGADLPSSMYADSSRRSEGESKVQLVTSLLKYINWRYFGSYDDLHH
jgi:hypothetical protein